MESFLKSRRRLLLPALLGCVVFLGISGGRILNPGHIGWLTAGDPAQHYLGWQFFRDAPFLQKPLGANQAFGMELGSSIVYTDSLPLLAFLFKPLRSLLPTTFQYMGGWMLVCFILQAILAWKLIEKFSANVWLKIFGAAFFTIAPPFLLRMHGHESLMGHWLILAALLLYFADSWYPGRWLALLLVASLVHAYLMLMVAVLWVADRVTRLLAGRITLLQVASSGVLSLALLGLFMWQTGYFMLSTSSVQGGGYGFYRMNLLSPFHANGGWSVFMDRTEPKPGEDEGFNFLGIGGLILLVLALGEWLRDRSVANGWRRIWPLGAMAVMLALYAFSNHLAFGMTEIGTIPLPGPIAKVASVYRASGRLFWPVFYLIYLGAMYVLATRYTPRMAAGILGFLLCLQVADCAGALVILHKKLADRPPWVSSLQSPFWSAAATQYKKIIYIPPHNVPRNYFELCAWAAAHHMAINIGAFARTDPAIQAKMTAQVTQTVRTAAFEQDVLYVFESGPLWTASLSTLRPGDRAGVIDGFRMLAPHWSQCNPCTATGAFGPDGTIEQLVPYRLGTPIAFDERGNGPDYMADGFSAPEAWGTWTEGKRSTLAFRLADTVKTDLNFVMANYAYVLAKHPTQRVEAIVNGQSVGKLSYLQPGVIETRVLRIPKELALERGGRITIELLLPDAVTPSELGEPADGRRIALGMVSGVLTEGK